MGRCRGRRHLCFLDPPRIARGGEEPVDHKHPLGSSMAVERKRTMAEQAALEVPAALVVRCRLDSSAEPADWDTWDSLRALLDQADWGRWGIRTVWAGPVARNRLGKGSEQDRFAGRAGNIPVDALIGTRMLRV